MAKHTIETINMKKLGVGFNHQLFSLNSLERKPTIEENSAVGEKVVDVLHNKIIDIKTELEARDNAFF